MAQQNKNSGNGGAKGKGKAIIFTIELIVIVAMVAIIYFLLNPPQGSGLVEGPKVTVLEPDNLEIHDQVKDNETMKGYMNIALFGLDAKTEKQLYKGSRSDSIMIASINLDTGDIKLVSVYRDTYLNLGTDEYKKCNSAYSYGGAEQAVKMLNMNLDMDITDFVAVGYKGISEVIDGLGGIYIEIDSDELTHINSYQKDIADVLECDYKKITDTGYQKLDGVQATAYCRIRYTKGSDFQRAARQREVIKAIEEQAKKVSAGTLVDVFNDVIGDVYTSIDSSTILDLLGNIMNYRIVEEAGFPEQSIRTTATIGSKGNCVIPYTLEKNVVWLHKFFFGDENYTASDSVKAYSQQIEADTNPYIK
jgi:LCP family protein required for cell wall assembly